MDGCKLYEGGGVVGAFIVWSLTSALFMVLGVVCFFYKKPMYFWTVKEMYRVRDIKKYNAALGKLWIGFAIVFEMLGLPLLLGQNMPWVIITLLGTVWLVIILMAIYTRIEKKYRIKE